MCIVAEGLVWQVSASPRRFLLAVTSNDYFDDNSEEPTDSGCDSHEYIHDRILRLLDRRRFTTSEAVIFATVKLFVHRFQGGFLQDSQIFFVSRILVPESVSGLRPSR